MIRSRVASRFPPARVIPATEERLTRRQDPFGIVHFWDLSDQNGSFETGGKAKGYEDAVSKIGFEAFAVWQVESSGERREWHSEIQPLN